MFSLVTGQKPLFCDNSGDCGPLRIGNCCCSHWAETKYPHHLVAFLLRFLQATLTHFCHVMFLCGRFTVYNSCSFPSLPCTVYPHCAVFEQYFLTTPVYPLTVRQADACVHTPLFDSSEHVLFNSTFSTAICRNSSSCLMTSARPSPSSLSSTILPDSKVNNSLSAGSCICCWKSM